MKIELSKWICVLTLLQFICCMLLWNWNIVWFHYSFRFWKSFSWGDDRHLPDIISLYHTQTNCDTSISITFFSLLFTLFASVFFESPVQFDCNLIDRDENYSAVDWVYNKVGRQVEKAPSSTYTYAVDSFILLFFDRMCVHKICTIECTAHTRTLKQSYVSVYLD